VIDQRFWLLVDVRVLFFMLWFVFIALLCLVFSVYSDKEMQIQGQLDLLTFMKVGRDLWNNFLPQRYEVVVWCLSM